MSKSRLTTALNEGLLDLPSGAIRVMRPTAGYDLSALPRDVVRVDTGFKPDATVWENAGYVLSSEAAPVTLVVLPRAKKLARAMVAEAAKQGLVIVDGQKTDGIDSIYKDCRKALGDLPCVTKSHGRLFWFDGANQFADWAVADPEKGPHGYFTTAGVFSDGEIDRGSKLLVDCLPDKLPKRMADFGAGWGYLSAAVLQNPAVQSIDLIEAEQAALDCARLNVVDDRASFHWADATTWKSDGYAGIVMNPPFHTGGDATPALGRAFIANAAKNLLASGQMWMVANRHLPYEAALREYFRNVDEIGGDGAFKVFHATRPIR
ncbi:MFS transporter [Marivivens niveibacter]|uniref:MFS transporter n=1 Tax=Marivivens niveibacter TaxID=1930667 RepID=A0A251X0B9_9RHOB|nr:methyltransferase [Marivivens niveibacter]OUD10137.1 MFS transporter [Marivivens niveibacter]